MTSSGLGEQADAVEAARSTLSAAGFKLFGTWRDNHATAFRQTAFDPVQQATRNIAAAITRADHTASRAISALADLGVRV